MFKFSYNFFETFLLYFWFLFACKDIVFSSNRQCFIDFFAYYRDKINLR